MLEKCQTTQERWGGVNAMLDRWLIERQEVLVRYCRLSEIVDIEEDENNARAVDSLCQILVDYISAGHFEIYDQLWREGVEFDDQAGLKKSRKAFTVVEKCTEKILDFNDKYQESDDLSMLADDLSDLGEILANRFEAEDHIIDLLHDSHRDLLESLPN